MIITLIYLFLLTLCKAYTTDFRNQETSDLCLVCLCSTDQSRVDCSRRGLSDIPDGPYSQVHSLNISNNEFSSLPVKLRGFYNLVILDVSNNQISEIPGSALSNLTKLEIFNLSRNSIKEWLNLSPNEILVPATNIKTLNLSHNRLLTMGNLANQELLISSSLETLILENCDITSIFGRSPLNGLNNIKTLNLNYNPLSRIQSLASPTLKNLYLSNCQLTSINYNALAFLPSLVYLKMSHNYRLELKTTYILYSDTLRFLDISYCNVLQPMIQGFPNLRKAVIHHNLIRFLKSEEFTNNTKLEYLDLSYNNIGSLKSDTFRGQIGLKFLDLSWNEIANIPEDTLEDMPSLIQISLSRNYITKVGHLKSTSVRVLDLSSCEISSLSKDSLEGLQSLLDLDLSRNIISHIPDSISSNTLKFLNLNYNRISSINNLTFFMLPRLAGLGVVGNRFTATWNKSYFESNPYLERLDIGDNMWRCDCSDSSMFDFYEFITLEPNKKEDSYNLICNSPNSVAGQTWLEACYFSWNPTEKVKQPDGVIYFLIVMVIVLGLIFVIVNIIRNSMKRRLARIQEDRERRLEEARERLRQIRLQAEQQSLCNAPDPRDLVAPPSYDEALSMPKLNQSTYSLCEPGTGKTKRKRGRRKTKSSSDLLEQSERNDTVADVIELSETDSRRRRRKKQTNRYGSHEIADLEQSPGARRRRNSEYGAADTTDSITVESEFERPLRPRQRRYSSDDNEPRESDF